MDRNADARLAQRLLARDEGALRETIDAYGDLVFGMARRVITDAGRAEEVAQDTFMALWRRPGAYDPERGSLRSWLLGVARNKAVDLVRREEALRRAREALAAEASRTSMMTPTNEPSVGIGDRQEVKQALQKLPEAQREAIVLAYFGGRTYREVAEELGIPEGTAKTRLRDGMSRLRDALSGYRWSTE